MQYLDEDEPDDIKNVQNVEIVAKVNTTKKIKNPCKICFTPVNDRTGVRCEGACKKWVHFECLGYSTGRIADIKAGIIKVTCPCPDCFTSKPKEIRLKPGLPKKLSKFDTHEDPTHMDCQGAYKPMLRIPGIPEAHDFERGTEKCPRQPRKCHPGFAKELHSTKSRQPFSNKNNYKALKKKLSMTPKISDTLEMKIIPQNTSCETANVLNEHIPQLGAPKDEEPNTESKTSKLGGIIAKLPCLAWLYKKKTSASSESFSDDQSIAPIKHSCHRPVHQDQSPQNLHQAVSQVNKTCKQLIRSQNRDTQKHICHKQRDSPPSSPKTPKKECPQTCTQFLNPETNQKSSDQKNKKEKFDSKNCPHHSSDSMIRVATGHSTLMGSLSEMIKTMGKLTEQIRDIMCKLKNK